MWILTRSTSCPSDADAATLTVTRASNDAAEGAPDATFDESLSPLEALAALLGLLEPELEPDPATTEAAGSASILD